MTCPKCGATPTEGSAPPANCPKCGLATDKMDAFARKLDADVPEVVRAAWDALADGWDSDDRHAAFMRIVVDENAFAWAAQQYRAKSDEGRTRSSAEGGAKVDDNKPDPRAEAMLGRVRKAAEARLVASATAKPEPKNVFHSVKILVGGALLMVIALLLMLQFLKGKQHAEQPAKAPAHKVR